CYNEMSVESCEKDALRIAQSTDISRAEKIAFWKGYKSRCSGNGVYQRMLAEFYMNDQKFDQALDVLENAIKSKKYDTRIHKTLLGSVYFALSMYDKLGAIGKDLKTNYPDKPSGYNLLGLYNETINN